MTGQRNSRSHDGRLFALAHAAHLRLLSAITAVSDRISAFANRDMDTAGSLRALALPREIQIEVLVIAAIVLFVLFGVIPLLWNLVFSAQPVPEPALVPGMFRPTDAQWADLGFEKIMARPFPGVVITDGEVATNDDTTTQVFSPYSGRITRLIAKLGDHVEKGQPLMTVAATEAAQAQNDLIAASDALNAARVQARVATENEARQRKLYAVGSAAMKDWQQAQSDLATASAGLRTAEIALIAERNKLRILGMSDNEIDALERSRKIETLSPDVTVFAPIAGTVILRQVGLGQYIQAGASAPVYSIGDLSKLWLIGNVREDDAPRMRLGAPVDVHVMALPGRVFHAHLSWIAPSIDATTHRLSVRAEIANPDGLLKPTMFATFAIHTGNDRVSPALPESAVIVEGEQSHVWVAGKNHSLGLRNIRVGRSEDGEIEALSGLKPGETVVTSGAVFIDRAAQPE